MRESTWRCCFDFCNGSGCLEDWGAAAAGLGATKEGLAFATDVAPFCFFVCFFVYVVVVKSSIQSSVFWGVTHPERQCSSWK